MKSDKDAKVKTISFWQGITFKVVLGLLIFDSILVASITILMNTVAKDMVMTESARLVEQTGNNMVTAVTERLKQIEALARSIANVSERLPHDVDLVKQSLVNIIDFNQDVQVAGGGVWFEPKKFDGVTVRKSFFWGRDDKNQLQFFDDYNKPGLNYDEQKFNNDPAYKEEFLKAPGYQNEEWYVMVRHLKKSGLGFWSKSYMDPYSFQPMVTVTVALRDQKGEFIGVSTIDLKLEGLHDFFLKWTEKTGGYIFVTDRNGKFLDFPKPMEAKIIEKDDTGKIKSQEFMNATGFAEKQPLFKPLAETIAIVEKEIRTKAAASAGFEQRVIETIDASSYQVDRADAELANAVIQDPMAELTKDSMQIQRIDLPNDWLLNERAIASVFHIPFSYWKVVVVKPYREYVAVANNIRNTLLRIIFLVVLCLFLVACTYQIFYVMRPLKKITDHISYIGQEINSGISIQDIQNKTFTSVLSGEIGQLADIFNRLTAAVEEAELKLRDRLGNLLAGTREMGSARSKEKVIGTAMKYAAKELKIEQSADLTFLHRKEGMIESTVVKASGDFTQNSSSSKDNPLFNRKLDKAELLRDEKKVALPIVQANGDAGFAMLDYTEDRLRPEDQGYLDALSSSLTISLTNVDYLTNMESLVKERTAKLAEKTKDIQNMLQNMKQGVFTIVEGQKIHPEYSIHLEKILETTKIAHENALQLLLTDSSIGADIADQTKFVLNSVGDNAMAWEVNNAVLPREFRKKTPDGKREKVLELDWDPIISEADVLEKIMVTVRDVTELRQLQAQAEEQKRELGIIGQILAISPKKFEELLASFYDLIQKNRDLIQANKSFNDITKRASVVAILFRNMHTLKGSSRVFGLSYVTDVVHSAENSYDVLRKEAATEWNPKKLLKELDEVTSYIKIYEKTYKDKIGGLVAKATANQTLVPSILIKYLSEGIHKSGKELTEHVQGFLAGLNSLAIGDVLEDIIESLPKLARDLGKEPPRVTIEDNSIRVDRECARVLKDAFIHIFRNSLDHGIETPDERRLKGKPAVGEIRVRLEIVNSHLVVRVFDDGQGLDLKKLAAKGKEFGAAAKTDQEIANLVFLSGLSTAAKVSEISGRGVGMDAVQASIRESGGDLTINLLEADPKTNNKRFELDIKLPNKFGIRLAA